MDKKQKLQLLVGTLFIVVFNVTFFVLGGTDHPKSVWIAYRFIHFAYLMMLVLPMFVQRTKSAALTGAPMCAISMVYFAIEFVVGLLFVFIRSESYKASLIVQLILAALFVVTAIIGLLVNGRTVDNVQRQEKEVAYIKDVASRLKLLQGKLTDKQANVVIENLYDLVHASPTRSSEKVLWLEEDILNKMNSLENAVYANDIEGVCLLAKGIAAKVEEHNRQLKILN